MKNQTMEIADRIREMYPTLGGATKRLADYVLNHNDIMYKTITMVQDETKIGYGTIVRFCNKLGFSGFQEFKIRLAMESNPTDANTSQNQPTDWYEQKATVAADQLIVAASKVGSETIKKAADILFRANQILVVACAGSFSMAVELAYRLSRLGYIAFAESDSHMQAIRSSILTNNDVLVVISFSGSTKELVRTTEIAKSTGAKTIGFVNYQRSPIAMEMDIVLCSYVHSRAIEEEIASRITTLFNIESLCDQLLRIEVRTLENLRKTAESVVDKLF